MTFEEYLTKRRVNVPAFAAGEPQRFAEWQDWYSQMHPESFYTMVKMVLNDVRRNYWLAEVSKPVAAPVTEAAATGTTARPAGRRAAIARPAAAETPTAAIPETDNAQITAEETAVPRSEISVPKPTEAKTSEEIPAKPARPVFKPRAIIKKPSETGMENNTASENPETVKSEEVKPEIEKSVSEIPANANPETAKPARPRAVIKRPAALSKPEDQTPETQEKPAAETSEVVENLAEKVSPENAADAPKISRPRPVFKRPASASATPINKEAEKTVGEMPQNSVASSEAESETSTENPVAKPGQEGASEAKAVSEEIHNDPEAAKAAEEVAAEAGHVPKPARPRPVFKRPATAVNPPENVSPENQKTVSETTQKPEENLEGLLPEISAGTTENSTGTAAKTVGNLEEKVEEPAPKPPRPRPVFKRPAKPESDNENH